MKVWIPLALGAVVVVAYVFLYSLSSSGGQGATSIGMVNTIGLLAVFVGLIAAGLLLRRAAPHQ